MVLLVWLVQFSCICKGSVPITAGTWTQEAAAFNRTRVRRLTEEDRRTRTDSYQIDLMESC